MQDVSTQDLSNHECVCHILVEAMNEGALVMSGEGTISYCNASFANMLALSTRQVQGQAIGNFLVEPDGERLRQMLQNPPHVSHMEITLQSRNSRTIPTLFSFVEHKCGSLVTDYVIVRDLSEKANDDIALEDRTKQLAEANRVLEIFSKMVFHDLRAPLRHIKSFSELLSEHLEGTVDDQSKHYLDVISSAVTEMYMIIDNLLYYYKKTIQ